MIRLRHYDAIIVTLAIIADDYWRHIDTITTWLFSTADDDYWLAADYAITLRHWLLIIHYWHYYDTDFTLLMIHWWYFIIDIYWLIAISLFISTASMTLHID